MYSELKQSLTMWPRWVYHAVYDVNLEYRRTWLGPLWITLSIVLVIAAKVALFTGVLSVPVARYVGNFGVGFIIWRMFVMLTNGSLHAFRSNRALLMSGPIPILVPILSNIVKALFNLLYGVIVIVAIVVVFKFYSVNTLLVIPALLLTLIAAIFGGYILAVYGTRYPDFARSVITIVQLAFLFTPIIWLPEMATGSRALFLYFNPFYHFLEILRDPLTGQPIDPINWIAAAGLTLFFIVVSLRLHSKTGRKIMVWL